MLEKNNWRRNIDVAILTLIGYQFPVIVPIMECLNPNHHISYLIGNKYSITSVWSQLIEGLVIKHYRTIGANNDSSTELIFL